MILAIDPGPERSAWVAFAGDGTITGSAIEDNAVLLRACRCYGPGDTVVIEQVAAMGMAVGAEVFETCVWTGRFMEAAGDARICRIKRAEIKMHLCGTMRAKDPNIRQALIDRYGGPACIKKGGVLHGFAKDKWAALAVGVTWFDKYSRLAA